MTIKTLRERDVFLHGVAEKLLEKETLEGDVFEELIKGMEPAAN
jgi:ATP-dependent Zn protease